MFQVIFFSKRYERALKKHTNRGEKHKINLADNTIHKILINKKSLNSHIKFCVCFWVNHPKRYGRTDFKHTYYFAWPYDYHVVVKIGGTCTYRLDFCIRNIKSVKFSAGYPQSNPWHLHNIQPLVLHIHLVHVHLTISPPDLTTCKTPLTFST